MLFIEGEAVLLADLELLLNDLFEPNKFTDICSNGIMVQGNPQIQKICFAVSPSVDVITKTAAVGGNVLIVHHNLFRHKEPIFFIGPLYNKIQLLIQNGISLFVFHMPLDSSVEFGHSFVAAQLLNWPIIDVLTMPGNSSSILGVIVQPLNSQPEIIEKTLNSLYARPPHAKYTYEDISINRLAIIPGGGHKFIQTALNHGAEAVVTGTSDDSIWDTISFYNMSFWAYGHVPTEICGMHKLYQYITDTIHIPTEFIGDQNIF